MTTPTIRPEGFICRGAIRQTLSHGRVIFDNGTFTGSAGQGRFYAAILFYRSPSG